MTNNSYLPLDPVILPLKDGAELCLREVTPDGRPLLIEGFETLSEQSRYDRFFSVKPALTDLEIDKFTKSSDRDNAALAAYVLDGDDERPAGIARYCRLGPQSDTAELAITVADPFQHRGIGRLLLRALMQQARRNGFQSLLAIVLKNNVAMKRLLEGAGGRETAAHDATVEITLSLVGQETPLPEGR